MEKHRINIIEAAMTYRQVTQIITGVLVLAGIFALLTMPRSENPHITVRQGLVMAFYPGADELQMEKQVTNKIEQYLFSFEEIRKGKTKSETKDGQTVITAELNENVKDPKKFWSTLQHGLNMNMKGVLPNGVTGPIVNSDFGDVVAQMITIAAPGRSYTDLEKYLDKMEDDIKTIPEVSKIKRYGGQKSQIYLTIQDEKLKQFGLDVSKIAAVIKAENDLNFTGEITLNANNLPIFTGQRYKNEIDLGNQIISNDINGRIVRLKDVAKIERRYEDPKSLIKVGTEPVTMLSVEMQPGNNIVDLGKTLATKIAELKLQLPSDVKINVIVDQPEVVKESITHFMIEFLVAILAVIVVVMLLLPFRMAAISAIAAPVSITITFGVLNIIGIELHQVTLAALIIVLGMVVDDAIVVVDNYIEKLDEGTPRWTAAWQSATQLMVPIFTATIAIVFAFMPLSLMLTGVGKEFMLSLPITIAVALIASFLVAILITPFLCYIFLKKGIKHKLSDRPIKRNFLDYLQDAFHKSIEFCFRWPKSTLIGGVLSIFLALAVAGQVDQEFFPNSVRNQFNLEIWLPNGTSLKETERAVNKVEAEISKDKRIVNTASFIGSSSPRFHSNYSPETPKENYAQIFINTISGEATDELAKEYLNKFNGFLPDGHVHIRQLSFKESPSPIEVRVIGDNLSEQKKIALKVSEILKAANGTNWVRGDYQDEYFGIKATIKEEDASRLGVSTSAISQTLGAGLKGYPVSTLWEGDKPVDILLRLDQQNRSNFSDLGNIHVSSQSGNKISLKEVVNFKPSWHTGIVAHRNGLRTLTVKAETQLGIKAAVIQAAIEPEIAKIKLPDGIRIAYGGEVESSLESGPGMGKSLMTSFILIFLTLLFQFKNLGKVLIVLATFPLSILGAFLGLKLTGNPMGFPGFMGIISLMGIVVRNGIILVDYADELVLEHGYTIKAAAMSSAKRRMRPVFLTSFAAAVGLAPMILGKDPFWSPLGSVLAVGLIVSMIMTLHVVPILYYKFIKPKKAEEHPGQPDAAKHINYKPGVLALFLFIMAAPFKGNAQEVITLERASKMAVAKNLDLLSAHEYVEASKSALSSSKLTARPKLDGSATAFYFGRPLNQLLPEYGLSATATVNQLIYAGGKIRTGVSIAGKQNHLMETQEMLVKANVLFNTELAYWTIIKNTERIKFLNKYLEMIRALLNELNNSYKAGLTYKNDVLKAEVQLNETQLDLRSSTDALRISKLRFAQIIGLQTTPDFTLRDSVLSAAIIDVANTGLDRAEIELLKTNIEIEEDQKKLLIADTRPVISLGLNGLGSGGAKGINPTGSDRYLASYYGTLNLTVPIFDWGSRRGKIREQSHRIAAKKHDLIQNSELINLEIEDAKLQVKQSEQRIVLSKASGQQADENLRLFNNRFKAGTITGKDVLEAQALWQQAYLKIIDAKIELKISEARYKKAIGAYR